jgi:hypothetical protein
MAGNRHRCQLRQEMCDDEKRVGGDGEGEGGGKVFGRSSVQIKGILIFFGRGEGVWIYTQKRGYFFGIQSKGL